MTTLFRLLAVAALAVAVSPTAPADDDKLKLPPLDSKEWKELPGKNGLKVWDVKEGTGPEVKPNAKVTVHYTGWLKNGKIFDSSVLNKEKLTQPLKRLIPGWQQGIPGMKVGGVRRLYIPSELAYGAAGSPPDIPGNADIVFEIELFETK